MADEHDDYAAMLKGMDESAPAETPSPSAGKPTDESYAAMLKGMDSTLLLDKEPELHEVMRDFFKYAGHGTVRGLAEGAGITVDYANALGDFVEEHPLARLPMAAASGLPVVGPMLGGAAMRLPGARYPGGVADERKAVESVGLPTSSPKEDRVEGSAAFWGDILGEFGGANLPFALLGPERMAVQGGTKLVPNIVRAMKSDKPARELLKDIGFGALAPGTAAGIGAEAFGVAGGEDWSDSGKNVGALAGNVRMGGVQAIGKGASRVKAYLHELMGFGTGAKPRVGSVLQRTTQDIPESLQALNQPLDVVPGVNLPVPIEAGDMGLIALVRNSMVKDSDLAGMWNKSLNANQEAFDRATKLSRSNFPDTRSWLEAQQKEMSNLISLQLIQANEMAEQNARKVFRGLKGNPIAADEAKNAWATGIRNEMFAARDDTQAATEATWGPVNKQMPAMKSCDHFSSKIGSVKLLYIVFEA